MSIDKVVGKYIIVEGNREKDFEKWVKVVKSSKNKEQLQMAVKMGQNLYKKYGEKWWYDTDFGQPFLDKIQDIVKNKSDKLSHEEAQKMLKDINEAIEQLAEGSGDDYKKLLKVINSVATEEHAKSAKKMIDNWLKMHGGGMTHKLLANNLEEILGDVMKKKHIKM